MESAGKKRTKGSKGTKRKRKLSHSDEDGPAYLSSKYAEPPASKIYNSRISKKAPAELFRKDLISAMKLPDNEPLAPDEYLVIEDSWKPEWEKGVQVPVEPDALPEPVAREFRKRRNLNFKLPKKFIRTTKDEHFSSSIHILSYTAALAEQTCRYDLDDTDTHWLQIVNEDRDDYGLEPIEESTMEKIMEEIEDLCHDNLQEEMRKDSTLNTEADEDAICDVCRSPDSEDGNEIVFCDACNICVHQSCYGITKIPEGSWICRTCALGLRPVCVLCPNRGGAMKPTRTGEKWCHVSCAIWMPEVSITCVEKMEPITKISNIPQYRWVLVCSICEEKTGACIQCSAKSCKVAYHVTCAFKTGLRMRAIMSDDDDALKLQSYCEKHGPESLMMSDGESDEGNKKEFEMTSEEKHSIREEILRKREENFFTYAPLDEILSICSYDPVVVETVYNYWRLKRRANFNLPLLRPREINASSNSMEENGDYALVKRMVSLRRDLERARNLVYMVNRRERLVRSWVIAKKDIFHKQAEIIVNSALKLSKEERAAVVMANYGDLAYDKKHTGTNGPAPNTLNVLNTLIGEENTRTQLNGILKMSKKNESNQLKKMPNPYAKHYLNGLLKRSQRWLATADRQKWENSYFLANQSPDGKREQCVSFTSTSDHITSDDGLDVSRDNETTPPLQLSSVEHKVDAVHSELCNKESYSANNNFSSGYSEETDCEQTSAFDNNNEFTSTDVISDKMSYDSVTVEKKVLTSSIKPSVIKKKDAALGKSQSKGKHQKFLNNVAKKNLNSSFKGLVCRKSEQSNLRHSKSKVKLKNVDEPAVNSNGLSHLEEENTEDSSWHAQISSHSETVDSYASHVAENLSDILLQSSSAATNIIEFSQDIGQESISDSSVTSQCAPLQAGSCKSSENVPLAYDAKTETCSVADEVKENSYDVFEIVLEDYVNSEFTDESQNSISSINNKFDNNLDFSWKEAQTLDCNKAESDESKQEKNGLCKLSSSLIMSEDEKPTKCDKSFDSVSSKSGFKVSSVLQQNESLYISSRSSSPLVNKHQNSLPSENVNKLSKSVNEKVKPKEEDVPSKVGEAPRIMLPRKGLLTGYKIPKKTRTNTVEESSLEKKRGNSPLSPLTDRTSSSTSTSSSYSSSNSYQTWRHKSSSVRDFSQKAANHVNHHQQHSSVIRSRTESRGVMNSGQTLPRPVDSYQWRAMHQGDHSEVPDVRWRPLYYQGIPPRSFHQPYSNQHFRQWTNLRGNCDRRPVYSYGPRMNPQT